jgi:hypothetical protein
MSGATIQRGAECAGGPNDTDLRGIEKTPPQTPVWSAAGTGSRSPGARAQATPR